MEEIRISSKEDSSDDYEENEDNTGLGDSSAQAILEKNRNARLTRNARETEEQLSEINTRVQEVNSIMFLCVTIIVACLSTVIISEPKAKPSRQIKIMYGLCLNYCFLMI